MAKDAFNSVSGRENSIEGPVFQSEYVKPDKKGKPVKIEEDYAIGSFIAADGRRVPVRNGKPLVPLCEPATHTQEQKKKDLTQNEERRSESVKVEIARKAKELKL